jgi:SEC-C motif-containing protein
LRGDVKPPTPEALMRSRYAAYVTGATDYILSTHDPDKNDEVDREGTERWSRDARWRGLEVHAITGGADDEEGTVEFTARYELAGQLVWHRERALFKKKDGVWFYHDGAMIKPETVVRTGDKVGRNDPCPCGSGKKHKKCCGK